MGTKKTPLVPARTPLSRERVLEAALKLADRGGLELLTMRKLGQELGVEAMALYYHFKNRDDVVDSMIDIVFAEIELPSTNVPWEIAMRRRALSVRDALARHRWAIGLMESRLRPGPANLRHHDAVIGCLRAAGFDIAMVAHAYSLLDSYIYGFALTKMNLPFDDASDIAEVAQSMLEHLATGAYPHLIDMITNHAMKPGYDHGSEFEYGFDVVIAGLVALRALPNAP